MYLVSLLLSVFTIIHHEELDVRGPLLIGVRNPLYLIFYDLQPDSTRLVPQGKYSISLAFDYSNTYEVKSNDFWVQAFDMESAMTEFDFRLGLRKGIEIGFRLSMQTNWKGFMDPFIQEFHQIFHLPNGSRAQGLDNDFAFQLSDVDGHLVLNISERSISSSEVLFFRIPITNNKNFPIILKFSLKNSTVTYDIKHQNPVTAVELSNTYYSKKWSLHSHYGLVNLNPNDEFKALTNSQSLFIAECLEVKYKRFHIFAQISGATPFFKDTGLNTLDKNPLNGSIGVGGQRKKTEWQICFTEDLRVDGPSVDFSLNFRLKKLP